MQAKKILWAALLLACCAACASSAQADGDLSKVNHIIIVMQENHSFDNYLGVLPYAPGTPYHQGPCAANDHSCVDGLNCVRNPVDGTYGCHNSNSEAQGDEVFAFHSSDFCVLTDLDHLWSGAHQEANFLDPNAALSLSPNDGFVMVNDQSNQPDGGVESLTDDETMSFYNEQDIAFYYALAETFAIDDRYFSSVLGPTFPNRSYLMAATSFGHLTTDETVPSGTPTEVYQPLTGTIFDQLDAHGISWVDYFSDIPQGVSFRNFLLDPHFRLLQKPAPPALSNPAFPFNSSTSFFEDAAAGTLPAVAFVDAAMGFYAPENDEHPGTDIRLGQEHVARIVDAVRNSPNWKDSIIFITYDEHGGFYDHVGSPAAVQGGALNPDGISPGQCADTSNPQPGGGLNCSESASIEASFCPGFTSNGAFPASCANFNQLGMRVPLMAVSPFSRPHYVSHTTGDHTSLLALIEKRFFSDHAHLTARDANAGTLEDLFDFDNAPSLATEVSPALAPPPVIPCAVPPYLTVAFFYRQQPAANGLYQLEFADHIFFGYYRLASYPFLYHFGLGWEYVLDANDGAAGVYFYDFGLQQFLYTNPDDFPYLYDFGTSKWLYYYSGTSRYFYEFGGRGLFFSAPG
jgi:phospholipase C